MRLRFALPLGAIGGVLLDVASPGLEWWPAAFVGAALIFAALWQRRARSGLLVGAVAGAAFWGPHIFWLTLYLGPVPWLGLACVMVFWFALFGAAVSFVTSTLGVGSRSLRATVLSALAVAGLWVLREQLQGAVPYGGFAWGRLAHTQADGPLAQAVSWLGFAGLSGLIALAAALPVAAAFHSRKPSLAIVRAAAGSVALLLVLALIPNAPLQETGTVRVAAVQGNSKSGVFDDRDSGDVLNDHIAATEDMLDQLGDDSDALDVIVWPENSGEFNLQGNPLAKLRLAKLSARTGAPIVLGTVIAEDGEYFNSSLVWGPHGEQPGRYDKRFPVPFAEYMPHRAFYRALAPDLVDLVHLEYQHGTGSPVVDVETRSGIIRAGLAICFDIIFDSQAVELVRDDAEIIFAQTNNADFGHTDQSAQQLAIAKLRGIETGRALVNISTVGTSAMVLPDGSEVDRLPTHVAGAMVADLPLVTGQTPALRFGAWLAGLWAFGGLAAILAAAVTSFRGARAKS